MKFPASSDKGAQYEACAHMLAEAIGHMGYEIEPETVSRWGSMMYRLASADEMAEANPQVFLSGENLVDYLGIHPNTDAVKASQKLLDSSQESIEAKTLKQHLDSRREEAIHSVSLLRSQTPGLNEENELWREVDIMTTAGIYLDCAFDAREDAGYTADFTAKKLAFSSGRRFIATVRLMDPSARKAVARAISKYGLPGHLMRNLPRKVFA